MCSAIVRVDMKDQWIAQLEAEGYWVIEGDTALLSPGTEYVQLLYVPAPF